MLALSSGSKATPGERCYRDDSDEDKVVFTFTQPDLLPALLRLALQQPRLQTGQSDLLVRETVKLLRVLLQMRGELIEC